MLNVEMEFDLVLKEFELHMKSMKCRQCR